MTLQDDTTRKGGFLCLKLPSIELVTVLLLIFCTPRITFQKRDVRKYIEKAVSPLGMFMRKIRIYAQIANFDAWPSLLTMHMWLARTTTPTPAGSIASHTAFAISLVSRSCTWARVVFPFLGIAKPGVACRTSQQSLPAWRGQAPWKKRVYSLTPTEKDCEWITLPRGRYPMDTWPMMGTKWCSHRLDNTRCYQEVQP